MLPPWCELFAPDGERRHPFEEAVAEYNDLLRAYPAHGYATVLVPKADVAARADLLEDALEWV
jgi:predicted ATPase